MWIYVDHESWVLNKAMPVLAGFKPRGEDHLHTRATQGDKGTLDSFDAFLLTCPVGSG